MNEDACDFDPEATLAATCMDFSSKAWVQTQCTELRPGRNAGRRIQKSLDARLWARNYDANANVDDNSCDFSACQADV